MKVALLGLSQAGKKTFFSLLTGRPVPDSLRENEAPEGIAPIRDPRVDRLSEICKPEKTRYAENTIVLCPDMAEGAAKRHWLEAARQSDLLCMVIRDFQSEEVYHPAGSVDAQRDRSTLESELILADLELIETRLNRLEKEKRAGQTQQQANEERTLNKLKEILENEMRLVSIDLDKHESDVIRSLGFLCLKPVIWAVNVDESNVALEDPAKDVFRVSCRIETEIAALDDPGEREEYMKELGLSSSGLDRLNSAAYDALGLMSFYTIGPDEVRAWSVKKGSSAPQAAGKVHSDMERGFIRVEVVKYEDLVEAGSEAEAKAGGKMQTKGKDYVIEDGDICHFLFNV